MEEGKEGMGDVEKKERQVRRAKKRKWIEALRVIGAIIGEEVQNGIQKRKKTKKH